MTSIKCDAALRAVSGARQQRRIVGHPAFSRQLVVTVPTHDYETYQSAGLGRATSFVPSRNICITPATYHGSVMAEKNSKFAIVVAKFNSLITKGLLEGALEVFEAHGVSKEDVDVAWVPGSFELPVVAKSMAKSGEYAAIVCVGAIIRGATAHYDAVVSAATGGVLGASTDTGVPVVFGVLTTDDLEQALDRTGGKVGNKGGEAALTAIEMATLMSKLKLEGKAR